MAKKIGVLISGSGTNLYNIIQAFSGTDIKVACVFANCDAEGLKFSRDADIPCHFAAPDFKKLKGKDIMSYNSSKFNQRELYDRQVMEYLDKFELDLVCLAGYNQILSDAFVNHYKGRLINIHPSLLPAFKGFKAMFQGLEYGCKILGATVHWVAGEIDGGDIIDQEAFRVDDSNVDAVLAKLRECERVLYPRAIRAALGITEAD